MKRILVAGGSGLIGGHLVGSLLSDGFRVRAVGKRGLSEWKQLHKEAENISLNLTLKESCEKAMEGVDGVYNLAAEIGGVNFIEKQKALTMLSVLINTHLLMAARAAKVGRYFYSSSNAVSVAEVPQEGKALTDVIEDGHVWEKLFSEKLCKYFREDFGLPTRIGRLQNIYGPHDAYEGGRERAPAALCRKAVIAKSSGNLDLEIWGDGTQVRSFMFVRDAVDGIRKLTESEITEPVRLGSGEFVTINQLVDAVEAAAGIKFNRKHKLDAPRGIERKLGPENVVEKEFNSNWKPSVSLQEGIKELYNWIESDMKEKGRI
ncbi:MAG: NAD-dependent epimerase/dehydratase family protein [Patescibacteria group bacterium]